MRILAWIRDKVHINASTPAPDTHLLANTFLRCRPCKRSPTFTSHVVSTLFKRMIYSRETRLIVSLQLWCRLLKSNQRCTHDKHASPHKFACVLIIRVVLARGWQHVDDGDIYHAASNKAIQYAKGEV